jgi:hypothetical protein
VPFQSHMTLDDDAYTHAFTFYYDIKKIVGLSGFFCFCFVVSGCFFFVVGVVSCVEHC